jgi:hypothetical protein
MNIKIRYSKKYDNGIHPHVKSIRYYRRDIGDFFEGNRFPNLEKLIFDHIVVDTLELSFEKSQSLKILHLRNNKIKNLVIDCPTLEILDCNSCGLTKLKLVCISLQELYCKNNILDRLELDCPLIKKIDCANNRLKILRLNYLPEDEPLLGGRICGQILEMLKCSSNPLVTLNIYDTSLKHLYCHNSLLKNLIIRRLPLINDDEIDGGIIEGSTLLEIFCYHNVLLQLEINCPSLLKLRCYHNKLTKLMIVHSTTEEISTSSDHVRHHPIKELWCYFNKLSSLDKNLINLQDLRCGANYLTKIDSKLINLRYLDCWCNKINSIVLNSPFIQVLICSFNNITKLELNYKSLRHLHCFHNNLTEIDIQCSFLEILNCSQNKLTKLKLDCESLKELSCYSNHLTELDIYCPFLEKLDCHRNALTNLNGLEYCSELKLLSCCSTMKANAEILKSHIPGLQVEFRR